MATVLSRARAVADNERLWITLMDVVREPENSLSGALRASIVSVGMAVFREHKRAEPDFGFLIGINEQFAAGLSA